MDTLTKRGFWGPDDLKQLQGNHIIVGTKQLRKRLDSGGVCWVFLARNADPAITAPLEDLCRRKCVPCSWVCSMAELGRACGIEVGTAAAATVAD